MAFWIPLAIAGASAAAQGYGAQQAANASQISTEADLQSQREALELQRQQFDYQNQMLQPFLQAGQAQLPMLESSAGSLNLAQIAANPVFQQYAQEQIEPVQASLAQRGLLRSGAGNRALAQAYGDAFSGIEGSLVNRQQSLARVGQTGGFSLADLGEANVGARSGLYGSMGNTAAMKPLQLAQIQGELAQGGVNTGASLLNYYG